MTTQKASFIQNSKQNQSAGGGTGQKQENTMGFTPSHEQTSAYVYGLLSPEESSLLKQRVEENPSFQDALEASQKERAFFDYWADVPVPSGLVQNALLQVQNLKDESEPSDISSS